MKKGKQYKEYQLFFREPYYPLYFQALFVFDFSSQNNLRHLAKQVCQNKLYYNSDWLLIEIWSK